MTTPANWYPDPQDPAGLRYWDGTGWTEHRAPAVAPPAPAEPPATETAVRQADNVPASEQATGVVSPPEQRSAPDPSSPDALPDEPRRGAHRVPDAEWEPTQQSYESSSFAPPPGHSGPPTPPTGPAGGEPNKKLAFGIIGGAAAILVAIVVVLVFVLLRKDEPTVSASQASTSTTSETTTSETTSETEVTSSATEATTPPLTGAQGSDGDYTFSVAGTETANTITSAVSDSVETTADGMYYVVHLNVANTGTSPLTFVATFQALNAAGQTFLLDDEATAFLGGTIATIDPGTQVETPLVYDVPVGTEPDSILLRADPSTAGVELPLS